ncbi:dTDP-4-dehydrorhamnose reductase family protein [Pedobacter punctiformis]|uniref:dTDP-4-dehydrorhamnose reductase n=1 Tax=Pedobacter punctiformis TaxID=3004097 RepID=A0ABT4L4R6_9SPHI|nr:SDR family oxidoreductase [Pedobacter sp. HCMS5-2]MCZ4242911.1 SDR family oxidoreductase [Pedobacter sp. HCMS5-2]
MRKVFIIGSKGMAGHVIYTYLKENTNFEIIDVARGTDSHAPSYQVDVTDFKVLSQILEKEKPDYVVNCIGILNRDAEDNPEKSILLNSYFPHFLAKIGKIINFKLIHISTDCVFDGKKGSYTEDSIKDGQGFYAETKALGEVTYGNNLTIRTSIIGPELKQDGIGLFHWFMQQNGKINGYNEAFWSGVTTIELAKAVHQAILQNAIGLQHLVNNKKINKYELTTLFKNIFNKADVEIAPYDGYKVDKSLIKTKQDFNYEVPEYEVMIKEMKDWMIKHKDLYSYKFD